MLTKEFLSQHKKIHNKLLMENNINVDDIMNTVNIEIDKHITIE